MPLSLDVSTAAPVKVATDLLILPFYQGRVAGPGVLEVQEAMGGDLMGTLADHQVSGKVGDSFTVPTLGRLKAKTVMLVGLGPESQADATAVRKAAMKAARSAVKFVRVATTLTQVGDDPAEAAHAFAEGLVLGSYRFDQYKAKPIDEASQYRPRLSKAVALAPRPGAKAVKEGLRRGQIYGDAANWARDLVNMPALDATPDYLAREARKMAALRGLQCRIWSEADLEKKGFGGILGVGAGSRNEPRLIELSYKGAGNAQPIAITGKGITFDSGGLSLKQPEWMETMKDDMGGAAAALATMRAVAELKPKVNVIAAIPSAENMPGGAAIHPGDVLKHYGGKTSEVLNTDAEGRLVLADALAYLAEKRPSVIIDSATLTGSAMVALGSEVWAVMGSDQQLMDDLMAAGVSEGEPGWQLPLWTNYRRLLESSVADVKNVAGTRYGGAIIAALYLKEFAGDVPWAHLDVAGTAFADRGNEYWAHGGTGSPARTLIRYIESKANGTGRGSGDGRKRAGRR